MSKKEKTKINESFAIRMAHFFKVKKQRDVLNNDLGIRLKLYMNVLGV